MTGPFQGYFVLKTQKLFDYKTDCRIFGYLTIATCCEKILTNLFVMDETMELAANSSGDGKRFQQEIRALSEQMVVIREQLEMAKEKIASNEKINSEIENIKEYLSSSDICFTEYSDVTVRRLVEYIRVMKDNSIIIVLKGGIQIREPIETNN